MALKLKQALGCLLVALAAALALPGVLGAQNDAPAAPDAIVYVQEGDIWAAGPDGQNPRRLADGNAYSPFDPQPEHAIYHMPQMGPSGGWVLFADYFGDGILRAPLNGGDVPPDYFSRLAFYTPAGWAPAPAGDMLGVLVRQDTGLAFQALSWPSGEPLGDAIPLDFGGGCGGLANLPDDQVYFRQAGLFGSRPLLAWPRADTVLVALGCNGTGVQALDLNTGVARPVHEGLRQAVLSPDGTRLAGLEGERLVVLDWASGETAVWAEAPDIEQVAWTPEGSLLYTVVHLRAEAWLNPRSVRLAEEIFFGRQFEPLPLYTAGLYLVDSGPAQPRELWHAEGVRGVAALAVSSGSVYFTVVDGLGPLIAALEQSADRDAALARWPSSRLYRLGLYEAGAPVLIAEAAESPAIAWRE